jgi:DNA-binding winged helix-turn-helix (wHTH) protein/Tfp pilus assembly protein PilF
MDGTGQKVTRQSVSYQFGQFLLKPDERTLSRDGKPVQLTDRAFDLLVFFVENRGRLLRKDQIIVAVWPDTHIGEGNLHTQVNTLRHTLGRDYIETVTKHGYRFKADVKVSPDEADQVLPAPKHPLYNRWIKIGLMVAIIILFSLILFYKPWTTSPSASPAADLYQRALGYERLGDDEQALTTLDQALSLQPTFSDACIRAAYVAYELDDNVKADHYLSQCRGAESNEGPIGLKAKALRELLADNPIKSMELYQLLIDRYPRDPDSLYRFAEVATNLDQITQADSATEKCLQLDADNPYCRFQRMYVRIKQNRFDDVLLEYRAMPPKARAYPWFDEPLGIAFMGKGQFDDATAAFERLAASQSRLHGSSHFTTGKAWSAEILLYRGKVIEAARHIQQIIETSDNISERSYLIELAQMYAMVGNAQLADKFAREVATGPADPNDLADAAVVLASIGDRTGTIEMLKARSQLTQAGVPPRREHLIRGLMALAENDITNAIERIHLSYDLSPQNPETAYWLATAYERSGDHNAALNMFKKVRDLKGTILMDSVSLMLPLASYRIAECYEKLGEPDAAKPYYAEVSEFWRDADEVVLRIVPKIQIPSNATQLRKAN